MACDKSYICAPDFNATRLHRSDGASRRSAASARIWWHCVMHRTIYIVHSTTYIFVMRVEYVCWRLVYRCSDVYVDLFNKSYGQTHMCEYLCVCVCFGRMCACRINDMRFTACRVLYAHIYKSSSPLRQMVGNLFFCVSLSQNIYFYMFSCQTHTENWACFSSSIFDGTIYKCFTSQTKLASRQFKQTYWRRAMRWELSSNEQYKKKNIPHLMPVIHCHMPCSRVDAFARLM